MKTIYTATITLDISGDIKRMTPEEITLDRCDVDDNILYQLAFTCREELDRHVAKQLISEIEKLIALYDECKLTKIYFREPESIARFICEAEMTYLDANKDTQYIRLSGYEEVFKVKE